MSHKRVRDARDAFPGSSHSHTHGSYTGAASLASLDPHNWGLTRANTTRRSNGDRSAGLNLATVSPLDELVEAGESGDER